MNAIFPCMLLVVLHRLNHPRLICGAGAPLMILGFLTYFRAQIRSNDETFRLKYGQCFLTTRRSPGSVRTAFIVQAFCLSLTLVRVWRSAGRPSRWY